MWLDKTVGQGTVKSTVDECKESDCKKSIKESTLIKFLCKKPVDGLVIGWYLSAIILSLFAVLIDLGHRMLLIPLISPPFFLQPRRTSIHGEGISCSNNRHSFSKANFHNVL